MTQHRLSPLRSALLAFLVPAGLALSAGCGESSEPKPHTTAAKPEAAPKVAAAEHAAEQPSSVHPAPEPALKPLAKDAVSGASLEEAASHEHDAAKDAHDGHDHGDASDGHDHDAEPALADAEDGAQDGADLAPGEGPRLSWEFGSDKFDFGKVMQGDVLKHTFQITSGGTEELVIKQARPTCGCTVADVMVEKDDGTFQTYAMNTPIPAGKKVQIAATLQTKHKQGKTSSRIQITSNDPRGQRQLALEAEVEQFFRVNPQHITFQQMSTSGTAKDQATITTVAGERIKLEMVPGTPPTGLQVALNPADADENGAATRWTLDVSAGPGLSEGNLAYSVTMLSDRPIPGADAMPDGQPAMYDVSVTVMGRVTGMISINPSLISLGLVRPGQVASRTVRVTSHDPGFPIGQPQVALQSREGAEWDLAQYFSTILRPVAGENSVDVELRLDGLPEAVNSSFSGQLVITTGHPEKPEVKLPISGVCRGGVVGTATGPVQATGGSTPPQSPQQQGSK